ncbi:Uncharacterized protein Fot_07677 [Forsythia ovata]|uniref:Uncharacterized protein n=1 Tax=Forsythia ovata TaxID=205694 RepID=A0ABD1WZH6_9LAMI
MSEKQGDEHLSKNQGDEHLSENQSDEHLYKNQGDELMFRKFREQQKCKLFAARFGSTVGLKTGPNTAIPARKLRLVYFLYTDERVYRRSYFLNFFIYFRGFDQEVFKITRLLQFLTLIIVKLKCAGYMLLPYSTVKLCGFHV